MKYFTHVQPIFLFVALFHLIFPQKAYAYLDPGTGSYIFQLLIAFLLGGIFAVKLFWNSIKTFFKNLFLRKKSEKSEE